MPAVDAGTTPVPSLGRSGEPGPCRSVRIRYFAVLRDERGRQEESMTTAAATVAALYDELRGRFSFSLPADRLRVACNGDFVPWGHPLRDGDLVVFIPPVAGG